MNCREFSVTSTPSAFVNCRRRVWQAVVLLTFRSLDWFSTLPQLMTNSFNWDEHLDLSLHWWTNRHYILYPGRETNRHLAMQIPYHNVHTKDYVVMNLLAQRRPSNASLETVYSSLWISFSNFWVISRQKNQLCYQLSVNFMKIVKCEKYSFILTALL